MEPMFPKLVAPGDKPLLPALPFPTFQGFVMISNEHNCLLIIGENYNIYLINKTITTSI